MIEKQVVAQKLKEKEIEEAVFSSLGKLSCSHIKMQRTPLGEKISVFTSRPGLIVGKKGANIKMLTEMLKTKFNMENPQLEVVEIENPLIDAASVVRSLISGFDRFGPKRFKAMAYRAIEEALRSGAKGIEIVIGGRGVPGERAKSWRFSAGYLKKSGDISENFMDRAYESANLRSGTIGIKVSILHPDVVLPDDIDFKDEKKQVEEIKQVVQEKPEEKKEEAKPQEKKKRVRKTKTADVEQPKEEKPEEKKVEDGKEA